MWNYAAGVAHWKPEFPGHGLSLVPMKSPLWVDYTGRRFVDPPLVGTFDTLMLVDQICRTDKKLSWTVLNMGIAKREFAVSGSEFNADLRDKKFVAFVLRMLFGNQKGAQTFIDHCEDFLTGTSVRELAGKMNALTGTQDVNPELLEAEVRRYDATVKRNKAVQNDDQLRRIAHARQWRGDRLRTAKNAHIDDPNNYPLIAIRNRILTRKSLGGLQVDLDCRVLDQGGEPMAGLYAVGEASGFGGGGMHGKRALEGTFLGGCIYSGRRCAAALAG
jgi:predicted oxidoreductase